MMGTVTHLKAAGLAPPVCIAVHPVFAGDAYAELAACGVERIVSCNTIVHPSNAIDISSAVSDAICSFIT
jgi:ribose-phosphate pyrophosphokinase